MKTLAFHNPNLNGIVHRLNLRRGLAFGVIIVAALLAFEFFNYSTTEFALSDLLGDLSFVGLKWSTILALAFCGIDFAGIARLFTPEAGQNEPSEVWYLFGAWLLAATMNAMLTWWGVSIALLNQDSLGNAVINQAMLLRVVPIFVAVMVWLIRVLIIGTFSVAGERLFTQADNMVGRSQVMNTHMVRTLNTQATPVSSSARGMNGSRPSNGTPPRPAPKPLTQTESPYSRPEPTYHPVSVAGRNDANGNTRQSSFSSGH